MLGGIPNIVSNQILLTGNTPTSTQNAAQQQLIGGAISPSLLNVQGAAVAIAANAIQVQQQQPHPSQVSHLETNNSSSSTNHNNSSSGKPVIDAPMLSAMQHMFSTISDHHHTTPIYYN